VIPDRHLQRRIPGFGIMLPGGNGSGFRQ